MVALGSSCELERAYVITDEPQQQATRHQRRGRLKVREEDAQAFHSLFTEQGAWYQPLEFLEIISHYSVLLRVPRVQALDIHGRESFSAVSPTARPSTCSAATSTTTADVDCKRSDGTIIHLRVIICHLVIARVPPGAVGRARRVEPCGLSNR